MNMNFPPQGTILFEKNKIRYQVYSDEFYESTMESIIQARVKETKGNIYQDLSIDVETIKKYCELCLNNTVLKIIAIDISKETPIVVSQMFGRDLTNFISGCENETFCENQIFNIMDKKLIEPFKDIQLKYGDALMGTSYGVRKEYQHLNIGYTLGVLFLRACIDSTYKMFCGITYNSKVLDQILNLGTQLICEVKPEDLISIDKNIARNMKNSMALVAYIDTTKDVSSLQIPSNIKIRPSL